MAGHDVTMATNFTGRFFRNRKILVFNFRKLTFQFHFFKNHFSCFYFHFDYFLVESSPGPRRHQKSTVCKVGLLNGENLQLRNASSRRWISFLLKNKLPTLGNDFFPNGIKICVLVCFLSLGCLSKHSTTNQSWCSYLLYSQLSCNRSVIFI